MIHDEVHHYGLIRYTPSILTVLVLYHIPPLVPTRAFNVLNDIDIIWSNLTIVFFMHAGHVLTKETLFPHA